VLQTAGVFLRTQLLRGELDRSGYLLAMRGLVRATADDPRVRPVAEAWDLPKLLLGEELGEPPEQ
jgi:hypothetical protein